MRIRPQHVLPLLTALIILGATPPATAQAEYRWETNAKCGVKYRVHTDLTTAPEKFGSESFHIRADYVASKPGTYIHGRWGAARWGLEVLEFKGNQGPETGADLDRDGAVTEAERAIAERLYARNWEEYVEEKDPDAKERRFLVKGKKKRGRGSSPDFKWWEYQDQINSKLSSYVYAACYKLDGREVVLVVTLPCDPGKRPKAKYARRAVAMCSSLEELSEDELALTSDEVKDKFANTPSRKARLDAAKANIADFNNWDYFTSQNYIVLYSFNREKPGAQAQQYQTAKWLTENMEAIRAKFEERFPPHDNMRDDYSILRICHDYRSFLEYTGARGGVLGMYRFAENVKELVVFDFEGLDKEEMIFARAVLFHEGWHQYADTYFGKDHSLTELHRWWDEGMAEFFGAYMPKDRKGTNYGYVLHESRKDEMKLLLKEERWKPLAQVFNMSQSQFRSAQYAQMFFLMDFLKRGPDKLKDRFEESWKGIVDRYAEAFLETGDGDAANKAAFRGVNISDLEEAWLLWVRGHCL